MDNARLRLSINSSSSKRINLKDKSEKSRGDYRVKQTKNKPNVSIIFDHGSFARRKCFLEIATKESFHKRMVYEVADRNILSD